ncbi:MULTISPECIES: recombinase family protein [Bradyrhizobium]|uniref:DNA invertase Pin-like site-specific DNA recombinase n=1 Tax=Bradyrhizobium elkanii TaxID=29448 RepID=A0A8I2C5R9_BRAEL|nr:MULTISPECIES: recombinase family protein [Bradyrhizobium]MBP1293616.1 DNA invertase Pin-like site-specific DNA recombinase [Bradyrhizobium elkanii]MCP1925800.1 DNA invertase Pin-like site-specific DNA recombinase [Bradyrhizobium elkanii]MCS3451434.1 DNA invertase Pin-like site-specific DNA recombinase [Bradyrhizobium elkanii]MCS3476708.1 DNA invertase Pin-like site-specific DNA recombinase [Bradyrhizobium elkanii]MCS3566541.1 DNA invertase Pin-like site-specific DNA recombinase [Bradyrhizob
MSKITSVHLARQAVVYIRQSTADQVIHNKESQRRQYGLADRARQLGWSEVVVIDDDLGRSGGGTARPGFEKLLAAICEGRVGAVVSIEASRLARNGRDWHTLLEFCGLVATLIVDEDGVYDPRHPNDRLLLGMKGTMSEMELSIFRQRSLEALKQKARRGELFLNVAIGYLKVSHDRIEKDPDRRIQEALALVFAKFTEMQTLRQVHFWLRQESIALPAVSNGAEGRHVEWKLPVYNTIHHILTNPIYAGAYAFGRSGSRVTIEGGRKRIVRGLRREQRDWEVLIKDHHEGYITWAEFERNQRLITDNANGKSFMSRGSVRRGEGLLAGLLRCGHCGRKLHVGYSGTHSTVGRYYCRGSQINHGGDPCISFGGLRVDRAISAEVIARVQPLGVQAGLAAIEARGREHADKLRQLDLALEQARYETTRARRRYETVDPDNRLVAGELERRWNERLLAVHELEGEREALLATPETTLSDTDRDRLLALGADLERAWESPGATAATRKRIIRSLIHEIVVRIRDEMLDLVVHWHGGDHTALQVRKNRTGEHRWSTAADVVDLVRVLARQMPDSTIAAVLNRARKSTGRGNSWTRVRVRSLRNQHAIAAYQEGERAERGEATLDEAATALKVSPSTVRRLIEEQSLPAQQLCKGAPWMIKVVDLERPDVKRTAHARRLRRPSSGDPGQKELEL